MDAAAFSEFLTVRDDGFWELLATAVGVEHSLAKTIAGLEEVAFTRGVGTVAGTPSLVQQRVDALAAYQPHLLVRLARGWKRPPHLAANHMDPERDLLIAAWTSGMRFLVRERDVSLEDLKSDVPGIREEADVHFGPVPVAPPTWDALVREIEQGHLGYPQIRALDRTTLNFGQVDEARLRSLLWQGASGRPMLERLRILRGRENRLTPQAIRFLCDTLWTGESPDDALLASPEFWVAAEVAIRVAPDARAALMAAVASALSRVGRPQDVAPLIYLLLARGWTMP